MFLNTSEKAILVAQENNEIISELSVLENVSMSEDSRFNNYIKDMLEKYDLSYLLNLKSHTLSGGEKRIISLCRGIFSDASLVFIDEPTNDLDYILVNKLKKILCDFSDKKSFVIITHDDRIDDIADKIFQIKNHTLKIVKEIENSSCQNKMHNLNSRNYMIRKIFKKNFFTIFPLLLLVTIVALTLKENNHDSKLIEKIKDNQVEIFIPISAMGDLILSFGALPISLFEIVNEDNSNSIYRNSKNVEEIVEKVMNMPISFGLNLESNSDYKIYPLEYYDSKTLTCLNTLETYITEILGQKEINAWIDTSSVFSLDNSTSGTRYIFDEQLFFQSVDYLENYTNSDGRNLPKTFITIVLNDEYSFWNFISNENVKKLISDNYYIRSNETIELTNQIIEFSKTDRIVRIIGSISLLVILLECICQVLYMKVNRKKIFILRNYGIKKDKIKEVLYKKCNDKFIRIFFTALMLLITIIIYIENLTILKNYLAFVFCFLVALVGYYFKNLICRYEIKKIYNWRYR